MERNMLQLNGLQQSRDSRHAHKNVDPVFRGQEPVGTACLAKQEPSLLSIFVV